MKLYDCITFFNENDLLWLRLNEIKPLNPIHVIVEASHTHTGDPKEFNFDEKRFSVFNIRYIKVYDLPNNGNAWDNENFQRDAIMQGLFDCDDEDIIGIFDLDEIPRASMIKKYKKEMGIVGIKMDKMSYFLNCVEGWQQWEVGRLCTYEMLKKTTPNKLRNSGFDTVMCDAGWHFSFMGGLEKMVEKFYAYAHTETVTSNLMDKLEYKLQTGQSLWGDDYWAFVKIDDRFPKYLQDHQEEFAHLIRQI